MATHQLNDEEYNEYRKGLIALDFVNKVVEHSQKMQSYTTEESVGVFLDEVIKAFNKELEEKGLK